MKVLAVAMGLAVLVGGVVVLMFPSGQRPSSPYAVVVVASPQSPPRMMPLPVATSVRVTTTSHAALKTRGGRAGKGHVAVQIKKP